MSQVAAVPLVLQVQLVQQVQQVQPGPFGNAAPLVPLAPLVPHSVWSDEMVEGCSHPPVSREHPVEGSAEPPGCDIQV